MFAFNRNAATKRAAPLPPKLSSLLREAWWIVSIAVGLYLALILTTYRPEDAAWSHTGTRLTVRNAGGELGAFLSDIMLFLFGVSAWWWVLLMAYAVLRSYKHIDTGGLIDRHSALITALGFGMLLLASCGVEALRFYSFRAALPLARAASEA